MNVSMMKKKCIGIGVIASLSYFFIIYTILNNDENKDNLRNCCEKLHFEELYFDSFIQQLKKFDYSQCPNVLNFINNL